MPVTINGSNTPTAGGVVYGDGSAYASTTAGSAGSVLYSAGASAPAFTAVGTAGQVLQSNGAAAPSWATAASSQWTTSGSNIYYTTGGVSIGAVANSAKLDIGGFSTTNLTTVALAITDAPSTANAGLQIAFRNPSTTYTYASVGYSNEAGGSSGALLFYTNPSVFANTNTEQARITSAGRLGVGTTAPASKFVVANGSAEALEFNPTGGTSGGAYIQGYNRSTFVYTPVDITASSFAVYPQGGASKINVNFNGLGLGTGTPSSGIGITFPATQSASTDANTLDDYDEYTAASSPCTLALTVSVVWKLTKVGKIVTLTLPPTFGTCASASSAWQYGVLLPSKYRPATTITLPVGLKDNGSVVTGTMGMIYINTAGEIRVYKSFNGTDTFTNATTIGIAQDAGTSISWII
jgi:hypothetical protein